MKTKPPVEVTQTKAYGGVHLPLPQDAPKADDALVMRAAKIKGTDKDNNWEAVNLVKLDDGTNRWIATAECRGVGVQLVVPRHVIKQIVAANGDPKETLSLMAPYARKLRKKLANAIQRARLRPLPAVPTVDPTDMTVVGNEDA